MLFCKGDDFKGRLRLLGELAGYLDVNKPAIISESFPSYSSHQHLKEDMLIFIPTSTTKI